MISQRCALTGDELSIKLIEAAAAVRTASPTDKAVLFALAYHASDTGRCWPSVPTLCEHTQLSDRAVRNALKRLAAGGHIEVIHRHRHASLFTLHLVPVRRHVVQATLHHVPLRPAPRAARTVIEPSMNLRDAKSVSAEDRELEAHARALCFRTRVTGESAAAYRGAMKAHEEAMGTTAMHLLAAAGRRRLDGSDV